MLCFEFCFTFSPFIIFLLVEVILSQNKIILTFFFYLFALYFYESFCFLFDREEASLRVSLSD